MEEYTGKEISSPYLLYTIKGEQAVYIPEKIKKMFSSSLKIEKDGVFKNRITDIVSEFDKLQSNINEDVTTTRGFGFLHLEHSMSSINRDNSSATNGYIGHMYRVYDRVHGEGRELDGILLSIIYYFEYFENGSYIEPKITARLLRDTDKDGYDNTPIGDEYDLGYYKESFNMLKNDVYYQKLNNEVVSTMVKDIVFTHPYIKEDYKEIINLAYRINNTIRNFIDAVNKDGDYVKKDDES